MPEGIVATVDGGLATLDFVDVSLRGPALVKLLEIGGPETIQTITRKGPRRMYQVPEGNARLAGLIDEPIVARGLNADGTPSEDATGGTGTTTATDDVGANDTGAALALKNANPNTGSSITGADGPAATGTVDWHTPTAEYTSANKYVGQVPNANVLHNRDQVLTGTGTSVGSAEQHPPTHADVIAYVKANSTGFQRSEAVREPVIPASHINTALKSQPAALGSDPGGYAPQPSTASEPFVAGRVTPTDTSLVDNASGGASAGRNERPVGIPDGEPDETWKRSELNAYGAWKGIDTSGLPNKPAVLAVLGRGR